MAERSRGHLVRPEGALLDVIDFIILLAVLESAEPSAVEASGLIPSYSYGGRH